MSRAGFGRSAVPSLSRRIIERLALRFQDADFAHEWIAAAYNKTPFDDKMELAPFLDRENMMADSDTARPLRVFLCHASTDKAAVRELYQRLHADGIDAWLDEENLLPGQDWQVEISKAVRQSDVVLVCLSPRSINKEGYVQKEIRIALDVADEKPEGTIFLMPLRLEDCAVPERLTRWQWVNLFSTNGHERLMRALQVRATGLGLGASPSAAPAPQSEAYAAPAQSVSNVSSGVNLEGQQVSVGNDVVGRDKIIQANTYIEHATIIQSTPQVEDTQDVSTAKYNIEVRKFGGMEFVRVPAGKFLMGSTDDDRLARDDEKPQHKVEIPYDYWMGRYPVTIGQFAAFVKTAKYNFKLDENWRNKAAHPASKVSWNNAAAYCKWLSKRLTADLEGLVLRLPTEAEWEKAARGTDGRLFPWGNEWPDEMRCNFDNHVGDTTPVGQFNPRDESLYGCADMAGNVLEWTHSLFVQYPYNPRDGREAPWIDDRVLRGGSFESDERGLRCASRCTFNPYNHLAFVGFRVVVSLLDFGR
jgi:formylglycine-generating enzyme required for sulfatase activity